MHKVTTPLTVCARTGDKTSREMAALFAQTTKSMGEVYISNTNDLWHHLEESLHILQEEDTVQSLLKKTARYNKDNWPTKLKTCFLRAKASLQGNTYSPIEKNEILLLMMEAIRSGNNRPNNKGRIEATHRFDRCVGVYSTFKNGIDERDGFQITELYTVMVVYKYGIDNSIIGITAFPLGK